MNLFLFRYGYLDTHTPGWLSVTHAPDKLIKTLELPWHDNKPNISCIPEGTYTISRLRSFGQSTTIHVDGVPGRSGIRFDIANRLTELKGCIAVGTDLLTMGNFPFLTYSRAAHRALIAELGDPFEHTLTVTVYRPLEIDRKNFR